MDTGRDPLHTLVWECEDGGAERGMDQRDNRVADFINTVAVAASKLRGWLRKSTDGASFTTSGNGVINNIAVPRG